MIFAGIAIAMAFMILTWDNDDHWKVLFCAVIIVVSVVSLRTLEYRDGYKEGYTDSTCDFSESLAEANKLDQKHIPEFCDD